MALPADCTNATPEHVLGHVLRPEELLHAVRYEHADPCAALAPWVERYWSVRWELPPGETFSTATVDDPTVNVSLERGGIRRRGTAGPGVWLTGPATQGRFDVTLHDRGTVVAVKFRVGGVLAFADVDLAMLRDRSEPASVWFPDDSWTRSLPDDAPGAAPLLDAWLLSLEPQPSAGYDRFVEAMTVLDDPAVTRLRHLADRLGCDERTVQRLFARYTGGGPKRLLMRARVMDAVAALDRGWEGTTTDLAVSLGWFDQAHLIRDFRAVTGLTPAAYAAPRDGR